MTTIEIDAHELTRAARALAHAGRWSGAIRLLDAARRTGGAEPGIALAAAEVALESDWYAGTAHAEARLRHPALAHADVWDVGFLRLRAAYRALLFDRGTFRPGPAGRDPRVIEALAADADRLEDQAEDGVRRGWARFYRGLIDDNLAGRRDAAPARYRSALGTGDDLLEREALRHLGDHDHDAGDHDAARSRWEHATALGARAGAVTGTLSQQLLLAVLHRDAGDEAAATALGREVARWATALGATRLAATAGAFLAGTDPTAATGRQEGLTESEI
ncbi:hypothetical protein [Catenuloplanes atrovinosus]|uniref:Tetratricopeptide (TPR) repeat protein n=1 Tax=Catenuloplanes atrovinosus TaxID=137266 RepID=A0AAE3YI50_9ACTN|nr:hypothetical protein [Catenuloplanes atrovinosus]MDR7273875.1 tetratricopeptide (TPR) repeat protein [Catenuloplanes atrovinosus]